MNKLSRVGPIFCLIVVQSQVALAQGISVKCQESFENAEGAKNVDARLVERAEALEACSAECPEPIKKRCEGARKELAPKLAQVDIHVECKGVVPEPNELVVIVDGKRVESQPVLTATGTHTIAVSAAGCKSVTVKRDVKAGLSPLSIALESEVAVQPVPPAPEVQPVPPAPKVPYDTGGQRSKPIQYVGLGVAGLGLAFAGVGTVFGLRAGGLKSDAGCVNNVCANEAAAQTHRDAQGAATLSTVFFVSGAALAIGGLAMFFLAPNSAPSSAERPSQVQAVQPRSPGAKPFAVSGMRVVPWITPEGYGTSVTWAVP